MTRHSHSCRSWSSRLAMLASALLLAGCGLGLDESIGPTLTVQPTPGIPFHEDNSCQWVSGENGILYCELVDPATGEPILDPLGTPLQCACTNGDNF
ncbi:MAG: hypothetical protein ABIZ91_06855 [Gemmatimonadaceae bacterium]